MTNRIRDHLQVGTKVEITVPGDESVRIEGVVTVRYPRTTDSITDFFFDRVGNDAAKHLLFHELEHFFFDEKENCWSGFISRRWMTINISIVD